jgi:hypothetical protein
MRANVGLSLRTGTNSGYINSNYFLRRFKLGAALRFREDMYSQTKSFIHTFSKTIFNLSSGKGRAGVAVIRVSGPHVKQVTYIYINYQK